MSIPDKNALEQVIDPVCKAHGLELVDVALVREHGSAVLRVLIDRERADLTVGAGPRIPGSGVSLADCQAISRDLSTTLDVHERLLPSSPYRLEVGSPGVDRPLVRERDFIRFVGTEVWVQSAQPLDDTNRRKVQGILERFEDATAYIADPTNKTTWVIPFADIQKANIVFRF